METQNDEKSTLELATKAAEAVGNINKAVTELREKHEAALKEAVRKDDLDVLFKDFSAKIGKEIAANDDANDALIARMKRIERYGDPDSKSIEELDREAKAWADYSATDARGRSTSVGEFTHEDAQEYKAAFNGFLRHNDALPSKFKALSVGSDRDGGYTVHPDLTGRIVGRVFETSAMRQYANVQTIGTDVLEGYHDTDEAAANWVSELGARNNTDTPEVNRWTIPVHELHAQPKASQKLLDDSEWNIEQWLANKVADQFMRTENASFVTGTGVGRPRGFATYPDRAVAATFEIGALQQFDTGVSGGFKADPDGGETLINALYGLKQTYRNNATWFMNRTTTGAARLLQDSQGRYIWQDGIAAGQPATLLGYPVTNFEDMADYTTAGALGIAVGDMREAYQIVDRIGIRVLRDPYTSKPYVLFDTTKRVGGDVVNFEAINFVRFAA